MLKWSDDGGHYITTSAGHLFCYIERIDAYKTPGHPAYEAEHFEWFIAPDDEDKNYRRAIAGSDNSKIATREECEKAIEETLRVLAERLLKSIGPSE